MVRNQEEIIVALAKYYMIAMEALDEIVALAGDLPELQHEAREASENLLWVVEEN